MMIWGLRQPSAVAATLRVHFVAASRSLSLIPARTSCAWYCRYAAAPTIALASWRKKNRDYYK